MNSIRLTLALALTMSLGLATTAFAGAPGSNNRLHALEAFCRGGSASGLTCGDPADCPDGGKCSVRRDGAQRRPLQVLARLVIDDDVGDWEQAGEETGNHAVAVTLEFKVRGKRRVISQIYQNADPTIGPAIADLADSQRNLDEALADSALVDRGIFDDFLFQQADSRMEEEMQRYLGTTGTPIVLRTRNIRIKSRHVGNTLATTIEARLDVGITAADE